MTPKTSIWFQTRKQEDAVGSTELVISVAIGAAFGFARVPLVEVPHFATTDEMMQSDWIKPHLATARLECTEHCRKLMAETLAHAKGEA